MAPSLSSDSEDDVPLAVRARQMAAGAVDGGTARKAAGAPGGSGLFASVERAQQAQKAPAPAGGPRAPGAGPDWGKGVPVEVLAQVARTLVAQTEGGWAAFLTRETAWEETDVKEIMAKRERDGNFCLLVFAMVCKPWRKAQLKVGPLRTRVGSDVIQPGSVALAKWALAQGCPRSGDWLVENPNPNTMCNTACHRSGWHPDLARLAAQHGHLELVKWLVQEQGFPKNKTLIGMAARGGNLELVQWLRAAGCPWDAGTCGKGAAAGGKLHVLQWLRTTKPKCPWDWKVRSDRPLAFGRGGGLTVKGNEDDLLRPRVRPPGGPELGPQEGLLLADHDEEPSGAVSRVHGQEDQHRL